MNDHFDPKKIMGKVAQTSAAERKLIGGSYEVVFYFSAATDFMVFTASGMVQAKGRDAYHVYVKPWEKSIFSQMSPAEVLEKFNSKIEWIEVQGRGSDYRRNFVNYEAFLNWLDFPKQLSLLMPQAE